MLEFNWPWIFYIAPLPLLSWLLLPRLQQDISYIKVPRIAPYQITHNTTSPNQKKMLTSLILSIAWLSLVCACAQPKWVSNAISLPVSGRDLMIAMDVSGSMKQQDFVINQQAIDRLSASKVVLADFITKRTGDRIGLIVFGEQAYLQAPLTFDTQTVAQLMQETFIGLAGEKSTAIGDAIGIALKRLDTDSQSLEKPQKILILLTDGANNAGALSPSKAATLAAQQQLKIYTIGIGADEQIINSWFGKRRINPAKDLDESTLKIIAQTTGGRYFRARDTQTLHEIYTIIDQLEPVEVEQKKFQPSKALFYWPLSVCVILLSLLGLLQMHDRGSILPQLKHQYKSSPGG